MQAFQSLVAETVKLGKLEKVYRMTHGVEKIDREDMLVFPPFPFSLQKPELEVTQ